MGLTKGISRAAQRQIDLTTAVCQERLLATHLRHLLAFVDLVSDSIAFDDALDIYVRVLNLTPEQARNVGSRALAEIGRRTGVAPDASELPEIDDDEPDPGPSRPGERADAAFSRLRRRMRGRVQEDLRDRINLAAARAEDALFDTHVQNGLVFVRTLKGETTPPEAVERYLETMLIPEGYGDVVYHRALRIIADDALPPVEGEANPRRETKQPAPRA